MIQYYVNRPVSDIIVNPPGRRGITYYEIISGNRWIFRLRMPHDDVREMAERNMLEYETEA